ncbi:MAG: hypothetical protein WDA08_11060 [Weeksellaceae bacterium]
MEAKKLKYKKLDKSQSHVQKRTSDKISIEEKQFLNLLAEIIVKNALKKKA